MAMEKGDSERQIEDMRRKIEKEREEAEEKRRSMMMREMALREKTKFMDYLKNTESNIN
eukprot:CAMPEP_0170567316 /NCGR_PEP_ID=MMETSP0211-20121228/80398_1 /TAXON_ID=311385 /ORGANISM="Pseudokeronopsis sp., Strain OXSARD2" /LENGTH=58 /DNA_ID=CAMNT_0010888735 /DNA_START=2500 /DNA_END=2676 /DNA_ORIENTATION=-